MNTIARFLVVSCLLLGAAASPVRAAGYPEAQQGDWVAHDFRFHTGEVFAELKLHYRTLGAPTGEPILLLHGTAGSGAGFLNHDFGDELFGPGRPLDARRYYIILPDALGAGESSKPSDGLRARFPHYDYDDAVLAQFRLVTEGLHVKHLRLVMGSSMGGMQAWLWGVRYPGTMDALVPTASLPIAMSGRNWMLRRMLTQSIRNDPEWNGGNYTAQPRKMQEHLVFYNLATAGGTQALYRQAPDAATGDAIVAARLAEPFRGDANDVLYQWESSFDYDPSSDLERIQASVLAINSADDERNPVELGVMEREIKRIRHGRYLLLPAGPETRGHGTTGMAKLYSQELAELLRQAPSRQCTAGRCSLRSATR